MLDTVTINQLHTFIAVCEETSFTGATGSLQLDPTKLEASTVIKRGDFGISTYLPLLGGDVTLKIAGAFETQSSRAT
jgi:polyisoprenoid-binding protein YceI